MPQTSLGTFNTLHGRASIRPFASVIGWQEADTPNVRRRIEALGGYSTYVPDIDGLRAIPISWRNDEWELVSSGAKMVHGGKPKVTPIRGYSWVVLRHRVTGVVITFVNTHMISGAWSRLRPDISWRRARWADHYAALASFITDSARKHPVVLVGDMNRHQWMKIPNFHHAQPGANFKRAPYDQIYASVPLGPAKRGQTYGSDHHAWTTTMSLTPPKESTMSTGIYLEDHPPVRSQFRTGRRAKPTGLIEVHTAESVMDSLGPDTGAEAVAKFIQGRSTPGSYHRLVDSDSVVKLVRLGNEAYGDGTGTNSYAVHLSFACRTTDWAKMTPVKRKAFLQQGAKATVEIMHWLKTSHGVEVPIKRIKKAESVAGKAGFMAHGDSDPGRRSDPGVVPPHLFPWDEFFAEVRALLAPEKPLTRGPHIDHAISDLVKANPKGEDAIKKNRALKILRSMKSWRKR